MHQGNKNYKAHIFSYQINVGPIHEGLWVLHKCDVTSCVNPSHLFLGTDLDNIQDMIDKGRQRGPKLGERHHCAKLTNEQVEHMRALRQSRGMTQENLAVMFGVSPSHVSNILNGKVRVRKSYQDPKP